MTAEADPLVRIRLDVSYDGTDFAGWAVQPELRTVQGVLQQSLSTLLRTPILLTVAGRTDAGVHARGQVAHFDVDAASWDMQSEYAVRRLAGLLPADVRVRDVAVVPAVFDARFSALWRRYEYRINDSPGGVDPLLRSHVLHWRRSLDVSLMADAASRMIGLHDFAAYCKRRENATTIRTLLGFAVDRCAGEQIVCTVLADAFCHSMVRSLVGALLAVGEGRRAIDWPAGLLARTARADDVPVAAAHGLTLVEVGYPSADLLAARADATRAVRTLPMTTTHAAGDIDERS
ncbi:MAG: tRNA pseudouridine(38-40) synthase TruA [Jatrophihabitantaceae bacterium]